ncbi:MULTISPECIES: SDR family NAD(P)-dependent oxidoreductase [Brevibacillus]|jgi:NAD(P)-dependent dehydrogenase (short-subunit alcohol dehydrogenase family)|uniref:Dehydrogenase n=1 Tax=Brevibacillus borstelensis AK1 TaxID=1300222 RepID=M8D5D5_9BACL|nr:SDR family NAD(P)-dependent oxidoreductase [Brevibacillus borstelensis]EMT51494.1 dehydrogenase [Brevibacillus borstelensis AK1]KKX56497.1 oxidoreductase [Brevibacillus borstelensis cifa_chp40]MBE5395451.1 SDR family oxidoreductase [Brevibacillus borstelensis]MCC0565204.1 SDR family NAD(P)-dependent oxidoreductase [Brevibacillus borstelensis]MCM3468781.1 SDR family NAD(P)-dependent oxidoreductase [Brevibacillus borstelensis]
MNPLTGKIALVTGGSRGAGRGIAVELAKAGATVYVTGRSVRGKSTQNYPGTIDDTAAEIQSHGGTAFAVRCDHTNDEETEAVIDRIQQEQGRLDILVNNVWGGNELAIEYQPFWELPLLHWDHMFQAGVRAQLATNHFAVPLMRRRQSGLIVHTTFWDDHKYTGHFYYDLAKNALNRMAYGLATELQADNIAVVAVSPGWMRTELVLAAFNTDADHWQAVEELKNTETPHYIGRAICALAGDPEVKQKSGQIVRVGELAEEYGFTDIDGRTIPPFRLG